MRIAVVTIALNETRHVRRWAASAQDADMLIIGDTGSEDDTVEVAIDAGVIVHHLSVLPWRFDDARNAGAAQHALTIKTRPFDYMTEAAAWNDERLRSFLEV